MLSAKFDALRRLMYHRYTIDDIFLKDVIKTLLVQHSFSYELDEIERVRRTVFSELNLAL